MMYWISVSELYYIYILRDISQKNFASLTLTRGFPWVRFKSIKNSYKNKHEALGVFSWVRQTVRLSASRLWLLWYRWVCCVSSAMAQRQHGQTVKIRVGDQQQDNLIWCNSAGKKKDCGRKKEKWLESTSGKCGGRKEWPFDKNRAGEEMEKTLASAESRILKKIQNKTVAFCLVTSPPKHPPSVWLPAAFVLSPPGASSFLPRAALLSGCSSHRGHRSQACEPVPHSSEVSL